VRRGTGNGLKKIVIAAPIADTKVAPSGLDRRDPMARNKACIAIIILSMGEGRKAFEVDIMTPKRAIRVILLAFPPKLISFFSKVFNL